MVSSRSPRIPKHLNHQKNLALPMLEMLQSMDLLLYLNPVQCQASVVLLAEVPTRAHELDRVDTGNMMEMV